MNLFLDGPSASRCSIFNSIDHWSSTRVQWQFACWGLTVHWANSISRWSLTQGDSDKSRPASDPVDSDLHQQSPAGETDGLVHRGFCFHTMNIDCFHLPCLLIDMHKMCCVFGFWFTGNLKKCRGKHIMRVSPVDDVPRYTTCLSWSSPGSPM